MIRLKSYDIVVNHQLVKSFQDYPQDKQTKPKHTISVTWLLLFLFFLSLPMELELNIDLSPHAGVGPLLGTKVGRPIG